jgi:UDP-glucose 4-epimerase
MKVLVTGSAGRIGRAICEHLRGQRHQVVGLDRVASPATSVVGDITQLARLRQHFAGVDAVIHTAALHAPHVGVFADEAFERVNVLATQALAELAASVGVRRFIFTSTTALYGAGPVAGARAAWVDEDTPPRPKTIYHRSKLAAEQALEAAAARLQLAVTVLRMSRCFPEPAPLMAVYRLHRGIDARDVAAAHAAALDWAQAGFRKFVVSGATPFAPQDAPELLQDAPRVLTRRAPDLLQAFTQRGWPLPQRIDRVYCALLAMRTMDWQPRHGFASVLAQLDGHSPEVLPPPQDLPP